MTPPATYYPAGRAEKQKAAFLRTRGALGKIEALLSAPGMSGTSRWRARASSVRILDFFTSTPPRLSGGVLGDEIDTCAISIRKPAVTRHLLEEITLAPSAEVLVSAREAWRKNREAFRGGCEGKTASEPKRGWPRKRTSFWRENAREARTNFCRCCTPRRPPCWIIWSRRPWCSN